MTKTVLSYSGFAVAMLTIVMLFITATTYTQLAFAILLYPLLAIVAYKIFSRKAKNVNTGSPLPSSSTELQTTANQPSGTPKKVQVANDTIAIHDIDKRAFLKLIGATGISFFLITILGRRAESLLLGGQNFMQLPNASTPVTKTTNPSLPTEGYNISEIDDNVVSYYGFINKEGGWFIMKGDTTTGSFRYTKGQSDFPDNWKNRANLTYNYFYEVFF